VSVTVCLTTRYRCLTQPAADVRLSSGQPGRQPKSNANNFMQVAVSGGKLHLRRDNRRMAEQELASC